MWLDELLGQICKRRLGEADEALDPMELLLRHNLHVDILKEWDQSDKALTQCTPAEQLPPVDQTQFAGGDGDDTHAQTDKTGAEPSAEGTDARVCLQVQGIKNPEQASIVREICQPPGDGTDGGLQTAGSSDASESTGTQTSSVPSSSVTESFMGSCW